MKKTAFCSVIGPAALLAAMGLVFCWCCPPPVNLRPECPHWMFSRMVVGNLTGIVLGVCAFAFGWRRWLRFAPIILALWGGLVCFAATLPLVNGTWGWIPFGPVKFNVWELAPLMLSLSAAWISHRFKWRPCLTLLLLSVAIFGMMTGKIVTNANRMERVKSYFSGSVGMPELTAGEHAVRFLQNQSAVTIQDAKWLGASENDVKALPCAATSAMPARATSMWGKWYLILLCAVCGLLAAGFAVSWVSVAENPKRTFILALGLGIPGMMALTILSSLMVTPWLGTCIPWASFGGSMAALYWVALGVLMAAVHDKERSDD